MNRSWIDQINKTKETFNTYWSARSTKQKGLLIGTFLLLFVALSTFILVASRPEYVPLYTDQLSQREVGDIKAELDKQGVTDYKLSETGTMILVPRKDASNLLVTLASEGYPKDNKINYDVFSQNLSFGATDRQYNILERESMQNQVAGVITHIEGIDSAEVILSLPEESVFIRQAEEQNASASVMVAVEPGIKLKPAQIQALYTLVSNSVPNLPIENITIMNQYSETLTLQDTNDEQQLASVDEQRKTQQNIERDIQLSLQNLLGNILGTDKVYVHTFVKMNFDKVKTQENLVEPIDGEKGIEISSNKSSKTSSSEGGTGAGGVVGTGDGDVPGYVGNDSGGNSEYEELNETVNYEVNRINNEIIKSPYQIEDITINVGVEAGQDNDLPQETQDQIRNIVSNTMLTALGHPDLTQEEIDRRITIFPHTFATATENERMEVASNGILIGAAVAAGVLLLAGLVFWLIRRKKQNEIEPEPLASREFTLPIEEPDYFAEQDMTVESQLKKLLEQRPDDFSRVIRTWINEEDA